MAVHSTFGLSVRYVREFRALHKSHSVHVETPCFSPRLCKIPYLIARLWVKHTPVIIHGVLRPTQGFLRRLNTG